MAFGPDILKIDVERETERGSRSFGNRSNRVPRNGIVVGSAAA